jgi:TonB family protein
MTASLLLDDLLAWSAQVGVLVGVAALAGLVLHHPRARLLFWQTILAAILALPFAQPWIQSVVVSNNGVSISMQPVAIAAGSAAHSGFKWQREYLLIVIAAGAFIRLLWMALGFARLRWHRLAASTLADPPVPFERPHVRWYLSDTVSGPVTFGWLRPSILLPSRINHLSADLREAIACHELVHVERADWLFVLGEELIRALLWFNPAVWLALSRVQLAREQTVDREVIGLIRNRERYLDALLAVAQHKLQPDVAPAPLFLKKRHLAVRVAALLNEALKETRMSQTRILASFATVLSTALIAARIAVWFFPLEAPAQTPSDARFTGLDGPGITVDAGAPLMHRGPVFRGSATGSGTVVIEAGVNSKGEVSDARVLSGPDELRKAALQSVLQWHYSTISALPPTVQITIKFDAVAAGPGRGVLLSSPRAGAPAAPSVVKQIVFSGTTPEIEQQVRQRLTVHEGDTLGPDSLARIASAAREVDEHFSVSVSNANSSEGRRESTVRLALGVPPPPPPPPPAGGIATPSVPPVAPAGMHPPLPPPAPPANPPDMPNPPERIRVGGNVQQANLIMKVTPMYPPEAKQARIQGTVKMTATINKDGTIQTLDLVSGHPLLADAAIDAVKQWIYKPTLLNGNPVEVITQIDVNFTLSQ